MSTSLWLIFLLVVGGSFLVLELRAIATQTPTLSQVVWKGNKLLAFVLGVATGVLMLHFWGTGFCAP